jgi:drug/metabolite transporter (DMT)-like permease
VATFSKLTGVGGLALVVIVAGALPGREAAAWSLGSGIAGAGALLALYRALALGPMSLVAPLTACGAVVPVIVALALGEVPGPVTGLGLAVAFAGALVVSRPADEGAAVPGMKAAALRAAVLAALGIGGALTFLQRAAEAPDGSALGVSLVAGLATVTVLLVLTFSRGRLVPPPRGLLAAVMGAGVLDVSANVLFAAASADGNAAVVAVLGSLYPLGTVFLARAWLGERLSRDQGAGVLAALTGVALIAAGQ